MTAFRQLAYAAYLVACGCAAFFVLVYGVLWLDNHGWLPMPASDCGTIHRPRNGCPAGFEARDDVFELDGAPVAGCVDTTGMHPDCIDMIRPQESARMLVPLGRRP